jgi:hypothetical protein
LQNAWKRILGRSVRRELAPHASAIQFDRHFAVLG